MNVSVERGVIYAEKPGYRALELDVVVLLLVGADNGRRARDWVPTPQRPGLSTGGS